MSDEKPPVPPAENADQGDLTRKPDRVELLREKQAATPKPLQKAPPSLEKEQTYGFGKKVDFDADVERELEEAMSGFADTDLLAEDKNRRRAQQAEPMK